RCRWRERRRAADVGRAPDEAAGAHLPQQAGEGGAERRVGVARCLNRSRVARTSPRTCCEPSLLSAPHPAFGHLPRFAEKGKLATISSLKRLMNSQAPPRPQGAAAKDSCFVLDVFRNPWHSVIFDKPPSRRDGKRGWHGRDRGPESAQAAQRLWQDDAAGADLCPDARRVGL